MKPPTRPPGRRRPSVTLAPIGGEDRVRGRERSGMCDCITAFRAQVAHWSQRIRVKPRQIRIQDMRHKWASCSTAGTVSFSTDLLSQPPDFREYVIVHELLHLKVPNHGKLFKSLLRAYLPNFESIHPQHPALGGQVAGHAI